MYEVIGHEALRSRLKAYRGSFAVVGPPGVGKKGIVAEWAADRVDLTFESLSLQQARELAELADMRPGFVVLLDGDMVQSWDPFLKPIEEGILCVAVWATRLPSTLSSRLAVFPAGYLSEVEVSKVLSKSFPTFGPRPWLSKALMGSFDGFNDVYAAVHVFEEVDSCLASKTFPRKLLRDSPIATFMCIRLAVLARLGVPNLPWSLSAIHSIRQETAWEIMKGPYVPVSKNEVRNIATLFFAEVTGGRLG